MTLTDWQPDLFPSNVTYIHPRFKFWRDRYGFAQDIDYQKVMLLCNWDSGIDQIKLGNAKAIVFTSCAESPRYQEVCELAHRFPDTPVLWLADMYVYDYPLPANVTHMQYRHWYIRLEMFQQLYRGQVPRVKNKPLKYKFSSLSYFRRPNRAVVTAALYTHARDSSIWSWRYLDNDRTGHQQQFIETFRNHKLFRDLDWDFFDQDWFIDQQNIQDRLQSDGVNFRVRDAMLDVGNPGYQQALINISNETDTFGWMDNGQLCYNRPGPFLTEKTWKTFITGSAFLNSGQPGTHNFIKDEYHLPLNYSYDVGYDQEVRDFDRLHGLVGTIQDINAHSLSNLVDANIDVCQEIQDRVLDPDYITQIQQFNFKQDQAILTWLANL